MKLLPTNVPPRPRKWNWFYFRVAGVTCPSRRAPRARRVDHGQHRAEFRGFDRIDEVQEFRRTAPREALEVGDLSRVETGRRGVRSGAREPSDEEGLVADPVLSL